MDYMYIYMMYLTHKHTGSSNCSKREGLSDIPYQGSQWEGYIQTNSSCQRATTLDLWAENGGEALHQPQLQETHEKGGE